MFKKISTYLSEVSQEISKVSWPTKEELYGSTSVVIVICIILAFFVWSVDLLLSRLIDVIF